MERGPRQPRGSRSEARDEAARAALVPLREGERPRAVTVGALVALALGAANMGIHLAGVEIRGDRPPFTGVAAYSLLMLTAAWGMWRVRYWAVLGMQALLALLIVIFSLLLFTAGNLLAVLVAVGVIAPSAALFWFLVKALARIQMPARR